MKAFQIENCAQWNDKQALRAARLGDNKRAKRLELQAFRLWKYAKELRDVELWAMEFAQKFELPLAA